MKRLFVACAMLGALAGLSIPTVAAGRGDAYTCDGTVGLTGFATYTPGTIDANVDVPAGASCFLYLQTVTGNVTVEGTLGGFGNSFQKNVSANGGTVVLPLCVSLLCVGLGGSHVEGNFISHGDGMIELDASRFDGNVIIDGASGVDISYSTIGGNAIVSNSGGVSLFDLGYGQGDQTVYGVGGNAVLSNNAAAGVVNVVVGGQLVCGGNGSSPVVQNVTATASRGQCAA